MFYLLAQGGYNQYYPHLDTVSGSGIENAMEIMYKSNTIPRWRWNANFFQAKTGCLIAAIFDCGQPDWAIQVDKAWNAVNVGCRYMPGDANCDGMFIGGDIVYIVQLFRDPDPCDRHIQCLDTTGVLFQPALDISGDCLVTQADITHAVGYFRGEIPAIEFCPAFPDTISP